MARILLLLALGFVAYLLLRGLFRAKGGDGSAPAPREPEDMVACSLCGVNMPRSESKEEGGRITCRDPASCKHAR